MKFDSFGLGYTRKPDGLYVHYPYFDDTGAKVYGAGFQFDPLPEITLRPTSERAQLWRGMLADKP